jgi:NADPH:quinone reductase
MANKAVAFGAPGGPEVLKYQDIADPVKPGLGQVVVRHTAIGVNYIDAYYRNGMYKVKAVPFIPGVEAVGVIEDRGPDVTIAVGTRVAYALANSGAYCQRRLIEDSKLLPVPEYINDQVAAASLHKGMVAHMLLYRVFRLKKGDVILVHNASDGVGQIICQWAKHIGALIIGTVDNPEKVPMAKRSGCEHVANYKMQDVAQLVREVTGGQGVNVVYDSVGKDTFNISMQCLMPQGLFVSYDQSSGPLPGINILALAGKSLFMTRPSVHYYKSHQIEMALTANEVFEKIRAGILNISVGATYSLADAVTAHADMDQQKTTGAIVLKV